ncbi:ABC transporter ATP-binding protein [Faecalicatena contorta]|uniref:ATP-binding cassette, subfamily B n=1 Tax=Faecalicatena contorta TaxID=39482 RepID=A0A315ZRY6_9FIRM|nr:ABC transporter ATP-binding protein [Faecalicatena contorta]PWJ47893.1 ATP-binding cassette subfamily B protein [Faecalicatena contorta]SUQ15656.1 ATP-binding cassette, subfamily B [Faecalicatena contorta]
MNKHRRMNLILRFFKGSKRFFIIAVLASLATTILNALIPQIFRFTIDSVLGGDGYKYLASHLWVMSLLLIGVALLSGGALFLTRTCTAKSGENFAKNLRDALFSHVQRLPMKWHDRHQTGDIIQRCTSDVEVIRNFVLTQFLEVFRTVFIVVVSFGMMLSMNVKLSLLTLIFVPIVVLYSTIFYRLIAKRFTIADEAEGELSTVVQENATGVRVVRAFGREKFEMERFREKNEGFARLWIRLGTLSGLYWGIGDLITGLQVVTVIVAGAIEAVSGSITVGEFIAFASYNTTLVWPVRGLGRILSDMSKAGVSFERMEYILNAKEEDYSEKEIYNKEVRRETENHEIAFSHVNFAYDTEKQVLKDVDFIIPQGSVFGILGGTGSGKSTIIQLLNRLYELGDEDGKVTVGGRNVKKVPLEWLRKNVGMVLQEPFLYSRTIRENIAASVPGATMEEIREAAKIACVDEAIMNFVDGYDTLVGERGVTLSGGQRQRIAIARMLLQKTPIMVFDDSLSAVDSETDSRIRKALLQNRKQTTIILISHRITTLMNADQIMVLHQGRIEELGTHKELIGQQGIYRRIYDIQMSQDDRMQVEE